MYQWRRPYAALSICVTSPRDLLSLVFVQEAIWPSAGSLRLRWACGGRVRVMLVLLLLLTLLLLLLLTLMLLLLTMHLLLVLLSVVMMMLPVCVMRVSRPLSAGTCP